MRKEKFIESVLGDPEEIGRRILEEKEKRLEKLIGKWIEKSGSVPKWPEFNDPDDMVCIGCDNYPPIRNNIRKWLPVGLNDNQVLKKATKLCNEWGGTIELLKEKKFEESLSDIKRNVKDARKYIYMEGDGSCDMFKEIYPLLKEKPDYFRFDILVGPVIPVSDEWSESNLSELVKDKRVSIFSLGKRVPSHYRIIDGKKIEGHSRNWFGKKGTRLCYESSKEEYIKKIENYFQWVERNVKKIRNIDQILIVPLEKIKKVYQYSYCMLSHTSNNEFDSMKIKEIKKLLTKREYSKIEKWYDRFKDKLNLY